MCPEALLCSSLDVKHRAEIAQFHKLYFLLLPLGTLFSLWLESWPSGREQVMEHGTSALQHTEAETSVAPASFINTLVPLSPIDSSAPGSHSAAIGEEPIRFHTCFLFPLEFRGRQNSTNTCSSSLFPPLESSGSLAAFPTEPVPGTNPSVPVGAQQAGETSEWCPRC